VKPDRPLQPHPALPDYYPDLAQRPAFVRGLFDRTARYYDYINRLLSLGSGSWYRRRALLRVGLRPGMTVLDVATGTGLVARQALVITGDRYGVIGLDLSAGMLAEVRRLLGIPLMQGLMEQLPVADARFDLVSMGYALRHVADLNATFREFHRVLQPGGVLLILEITRPAHPLKRALLKLYLGRLVPLLGWLTTGQRDLQTLMRYYWDTIENCVPPETIIQAIRAAGFAEAGCDVEFDLFRAYFGRKGDGARPPAARSPGGATVRQPRASG
jgi:demethylmenaquinone methyltransferase/2-methoxy-6-polyprenyl-1,4-benzoquinol methylase